jgi:hypothetical protein
MGTEEYKGRTKFVTGDILSTQEAAIINATARIPNSSSVTIGETLDRRIEVARKNVEDLCITKAKLEALNVLDHPVDLYLNVVL